MKNLFTLIFALSITAMCFGQKVDIDNYRFYVEFAELPMYKTTPADRTFTIQTSGDSYKVGSIADEIQIRGWEYKEEGAKALVKLKIDNFTRGKSDLKKDEKVKKNKEGKVTSRTKTYVVSSRNVGKATLSVFGPKNKYEQKKSEKDKKKAAKKKKKKKEKEDKIAANPFLKDVNIEVDDTGEGIGELVELVDLSKAYTVSSGKHNTSSAAYKAYKEISESSYSDQKDKYFANLSSAATNSLNKIYGYSRVRDYVKFKRLDSKKHPEFEMFDNATVAMKSILEKKRFNKTHDEIEAAMGPIIEYFISVKEKYSQDKKHPKRLKAAAMYNLAQIYYYLDQPEKTIEIGEEYVRWGHDKKDGKRFIEKGEKLQHLLAFHGEKRFFVTDEDADKVESTDEEVGEGN